MKEQTAHRPYRQRRRAAAAEANTERILQAALDLFEERPWDQITLAAIAERAGVGRPDRDPPLPHEGRRLARGQRVDDAADRGRRGEPDGRDPGAVAAALERHYERWGASTDRMLRQQDASPALAEAAAGGRRAHREWVERVFPEAPSSPTPPPSAA